MERHPVGCHSADRLEPFEYEFRASCHLLIVSERAERDDGETIVDGLPKSRLREFNRKLTFIPAGSHFFGWQKPRTLTQATYFYINPHSPLFDGELRFADTEFRPRLFFFDQDMWETMRKLKAQAENPKSGAPTICRGSEHRIGPRAPASEQRHCSCGAECPRRSRHMAAEESGAVHRGTSHRGHFGVCLGGSRASEPVSFFARIQGIHGRAAPPLFHVPTNGESQEFPCRPRAVSRLRAWQRLFLCWHSMR